MIRLTAILCLTFSLAACGGFRDSRLNPLNWFGRSEPRERVVEADVDVDKDGRVLVAEVLSMTVEPLPTGAIVRATGRTPTQGWWQAELVALPVTEDGLLVLEFRLSDPGRQTAVSTPRSREVTAALHLTTRELEPLTEIVVQGAANARAARR